MFYCQKKQVFLFGKKAQRKCINTNLRKRGRICPHLCQKEAENETSVYFLQTAIWLLCQGEKQRLRSV